MFGRLAVPSTSICDLRGGSGLDEHASQAMPLWDRLCVSLFGSAVCLSLARCRLVHRVMGRKAAGGSIHNIAFSCRGAPGSPPGLRHHCGTSGRCARAKLPSSEAAWLASRMLRSSADKRRRVARSTALGERQTCRCALAGVFVVVARSRCVWLRGGADCRLVVTVGRSLATLRSLTYDQHLQLISWAGPHQLLLGACP